MQFPSELKVLTVKAPNMRGGQSIAAPENRKEAKETTHAEVRSDVGNIVERLSELQGDIQIYPITVLLMEAIYITIQLVSTTFLHFSCRVFHASHSLISSALFSAKMLTISILRFYTGWLLVIVKFIWKI